MTGKGVTELRNKVYEEKHNEVTDITIAKTFILTDNISN